MNVSRYFGVVVLLLAAATPSSAQTPEDSVPVWTQMVRSGSLLEKANATAALAQLPSASLPAATRQALVDEVARLHQLLQGAGVPEAESLGEEGLGEYFLDLVTTVVAFPGPEVTRVLVAAIDAGLNFQQRVAEGGDVVVPQLAAIVNARGSARGAALETLAMAWFWADSTNAPLSEASRELILTTLIAGAASDDYRLRRTAAEAYLLSGDPAFAPVAEALLAAAEARDDYAIVNALRNEVLPALQTKRAAQTPGAQLESAQRSFELLCRSATGARRGACVALANEFDTALRHVEAQRTQPARNVLDSIAKRADAERDRGVFNTFEHALVAGGVRSVLSRL